MCRGVVFPLILGTLIMGMAPEDGSWPLIHCQVHCLVASTRLPMNSTAEGNSSPFAGTTCQLCVAPMVSLMVQKSGVHHQH